MIKISRLVALCAAALLMALPGAARTDAPRSEHLEYRTYLGGLPLGTLRFSIDTDAVGYKASGSFEMTAFLRLVLDTDARADVSGRWRNETDARPESFQYWVRDRKKRRVTEMRFDESGDPVEVLADPPFRPKGYAMTIDQAAGAVDPATAAVLLTRQRENACDISVDVFDGRKRHRVTLDPATLKTTRQGTVLCEGLYERIAGFKAKHMTPERRLYPFRAEFDPMPENHWRTRRVWADTRFGAASAVLRN